MQESGPKTSADVEPKPTDRTKICMLLLGSKESLVLDKRPHA